MRWYGEACAFSADVPHDGVGVWPTSTVPGRQVPAEPVLRSVPPSPTASPGLRDFRRSSVSSPVWLFIVEGVADFHLQVNDWIFFSGSQ